MKKQAFTLIELLVVVLIIGILAAIAVPQYQVAVDKTQYSTLMNIVKSVKEEQHIFFLQNGRYAADCEELAMTPPSGLSLQNGVFNSLENFTEYVSCNHAGKRVAAITARFGGVVSYEQGLEDTAVSYYSDLSSARARRLIEQYCDNPDDIHENGIWCNIN